MATLRELYSEKRATRMSEIERRRLDRIRRIRAEELANVNRVPSQLTSDSGQPLVDGLRSEQRSAQDANVGDEDSQNDVSPDQGDGPRVRYDTIDIVKHPVKRGMRGIIESRETTINVLRNVRDEDRDVDITHVMNSVFHAVGEMCREALQDLGNDDFVQVILKAPSFFHHVSTKLVKKRYFHPNLVTVALLHAAQSKVDVKLGDGVRVEIVTVRPHRPLSPSVGGARYRPGTRNPTQLAENRKCMVAIKAPDNSCMARSIVMAKAKLDGSPDFKKFKRDNNQMYDDRFGTAVSDLCTLAGVAPNTKCGIAEVQRFEAALNVRIKIIAGDCLNQFIYEGCPDKSLPSIYIYRTDPSLFTPSSEDVETVSSDSRASQRDDSYHYDTILDAKAFFSTSFFCHACNVYSQRKFQHRCPDIDDWCYTCNDRGCERTGDFGSCFVCGRVFRSPQCELQHVNDAQNVHDCTHYTCRFCYKTLPREITVNGRYETNAQVRARHGLCPIPCGVCGAASVSPSHKCYMQPDPFKKSVKKVVYLDFETDQSSSVHKPVYCYVRWRFADDDGGLLEDGNQEFGISRDVTNDVGDFLFSSKFRNSTIIAHNMRGFDGCFLIQYLTRMTIAPTNVLLNGTKLITFRVNRFNIRVIDSLSFLPWSLSTFPSAFGLDTSRYTKGYFPHFFTSPAVFGSVSPYPEKKYYGYDDMTEAQRRSFDQWYDALPSDAEFDFDTELRLYCKQDVDILVEGVEAFRRTIREITSVITTTLDPVLNESECDALPANVIHLDESDDDDDPIEDGGSGGSTIDSGDNVCDPLSFTTLAALCHGIFKALFLRKKTIAVVPPGGYGNHKYSNVSLEWLEFLRRTSVPRIKHRGNSSTGERKIGSYRVDGLDSESKTVYEFYGCFFHGHLECIDNPEALHPVIGVTFRCLFDRTMEREACLVARGYTVTRMWSCQWEAVKRDPVQCDSNLRTILKDVTGFIPIDPRESFKGGRTEAFKLRSNEKLSYVDVNSLYPYVLMHKKFPVGHPMILIDNLGTSLSPYFGFVKCDVLPPKRLYHPVLPVTIDEKLMFPLCRLCAEQFSSSYCEHADSQRMLTGTWFSEELKLAERMGYHVTRIYQVMHFPVQSSCLFKEYIQAFYKVKLLSSGVPKGCRTEEDVNAFVADVYQREGILLDRTEFNNNPAMRSLAKLLLNSFWGRFALREFRTKCDFVSDVEKMNKILNREGIEITTVRPLGKNMAVIFHKSLDRELIPMSNNTNIYIASATTAWARMELYTYLSRCMTPDMCSSSAVYCDTDSILYAGSFIKTGCHLGDMNSELQDGDAIDQFVSAGPKTYGYHTVKGDVCLKIKGFSLNVMASQALNVTSLCQLVDAFIETYGKDDEDFLRLPSYVEWKRARVNDREILMRQHAVNPNRSSSVLDVQRGVSSIYQANRIHRTNTWNLLVRHDQKLFAIYFNKRMICSNYNTFPFGFVKE